MGENIKSEKMTAFRKLIFIVPLSTIAVYFLWREIVERHINVDFLILYFLLTLILGYYFPKIIHIIFIVFLVIATSVLCLFLLDSPTVINRFVAIAISGFILFATPVSIIGCFVGKFIYNIKGKMNSPRLNTSKE